MARKSSADLTVRRPSIAAATPLPPPADLSPDERKLWADVVASKPADWFGPDSAPMLKEYVRAALLCDALARRVHTAMRSADPRNLTRLLNARHQEVTRLAVLGTKLRLTQQSRYTARSAATADSRASGLRPWQPGA
jgi:hypothetical protein